MLSHKSRGFATALFDKILIANRGEIACRIIKTCKKLGIKTVAVYSDPDSRSMHVRMADEAVRIGPAASNASYLNMDNVIEAIKKTGAQAVHPGYGFLSEKHTFAEALEKEGIVFIGPPPKALTAMGDKLASKKLAREAKVNTVPGGFGAIATADHALKVANEIGYPVMIKASAGGGGKGMRIAWNDKQALEGFRLSKQEAKSSFGDDTILVEKFIDQPRHIEIQVLGDQYGNVIYLNERECSIQRRNQKVLEEAPSTFLDIATRKAMGEQAVALAKAVGYFSAGTCEFLVDPKRNFYFLEMNTRLQVEHPVTEIITGLDLVEEMIRVAAKEKLRHKQSDVKIKGWALEARVYAEDPYHDFMPSIGKLQKYREPAGEGVRVDSGVTQGSEISIHYDPMISKLITYGGNRTVALELMRKALDEYVIHGLTHNVAFLRAVCDHKRFIDGNISTKFIPEEYPKGFKGTVVTSEDKQLVVSSAVLVYSQLVKNQLSISGKHQSFDPVKYLKNKLSDLIVFVAQGGHTEQFHITTKDFIEAESRTTMNCSVTSMDGSITAPFQVSSNYQRGMDFFSAEMHPLDSQDRKNYIVQVTHSTIEPKFVVQLRGTPFNVEVRTPREQDLLTHMPVIKEMDVSKMVLSPMPGAVVSVSVKAGDQVVPGQEVCVIEAMKMQNALHSQRAGKVKGVRVAVGQTVNGGDILIELE